jgi:hypothetical protein
MARQGTPEPASETTNKESLLDAEIVEAETKLRREKIEQRIRYIWLASSIGLIAFLGWAVILGLWENQRGPFTMIGLLAALVSAVLSSYRILDKRLDLEKAKLQANKLRTVRRHFASVSSDGVSPARRMYKQNTIDVIDQYRNASKRNRRVHNFLQSVILVGSIVVTSLTSIALNASPFGAAAAIISVFVSVSAAMTGYFKFRERSFGQQQTADAIEKELNSVDLMIWDYSGKESEDGLTLFAERVEALKEEQRKRELQLEQSSDRREEQIR